MEHERQQDQNFKNYQDAMAILDERNNFFQSQHLSFQTTLPFTTTTPYNSYTVHSIWEILPQYRQYSVNQSPLDPVLHQLYTTKQQKPRFVLPPPSQGQQSINQQGQYQPSFKWLSSAIIQSNLIQVDQIQPKKTEKDTIPPQWTGINQLLIHNVKQKIYLKSNMQDIAFYLHTKFSQFPWICVKKIREIFYKGKPSIIVKFSQVRGASFAYYNFVKGIRYLKDYFGQQCDVYRLVKNRLKQKKVKPQTILLLRKVPNTMNKQAFLALFKKFELPPILWIQDFIMIESFKYTICKVGYLDHAFQICEFFQFKYIVKQLKVNLHPKSGKVWKGSEQSNEFLGPQLFE